MYVVLRRQIVVQVAFVLGAQEVRRLRYFVVLMDTLTYPGRLLIDLRLRVLGYIPRVRCTSTAVVLGHYQVQRMRADERCTKYKKT